MLESGVLRRWHWPSDAPARAADADRLARTLGIDPIAARLLAVRGLCDAEAARQFLTPKLTQLHDPAMLPGAQRAADRIVAAVRRRQRIVVYGDYDVDGVTASAILYHTLRRLGADVVNYIPHRVEEGYGLNEAAIAELCRDKPLIVSVDCGVTACGPARVAHDAGADLIITDHHEFDASNLPEAYAIVHPRVPVDGQPAYPFGDLCGAGVAFKLAWLAARTWCGGAERLPQDLRDLMIDLLSLAALGTVADIVPLVGENRVIATFGLGQIKRTRFTGLNALIDASRLRDEKIDAYHVGFVLGPRLNACGRMGHAADALRLLTTDDPAEARDIAQMLCRVNEERRQTEREIFEQARQMVIDNGYNDPAVRAIVVGGEGWHPGVVGIVASRLVDEFARPVVMLHYDAETHQAKGSARSVDKVSIHEAFEHCAQYFLSWGGHAMAAGLRMERDRVDDFRKELIRFMNERLTPDDLVRGIHVDVECTLADANVECWSAIERLAPFGRCNATPVLCARRVRVERPPMRLGAQGRHLKLLLRGGDRLAEAIGFGMGELASSLAVGAHLDVVFEPKLSTWQGRRRAELHLRDFKLLPA